jgi:hypothetical protein
MVVVCLAASAARGSATAEELEDYRAGLESLPPRARDVPGGPLDLERLRLFNPGDDEPRAKAKLAALSPAQQLRLWRRRALVHEVIRRWDERLRWSARPEWTSLMGWDRGTPAISYLWAFSRRQGLESSAEDLATFAEELLVPPESMNPDGIEPDERVRCRELSKSRFLDDRLHALDPSWQPQRRCPAFDAWADPEQVRGFEVAFTAPSTAGAQSLFGHLFLVIVREGPVEQQQAVQMAALISPFEPRGASYLVKGLSGGYRGIYELTAMADVLHEALELDQRGIRRFRLRLGVEQRVHLLERIWELERIGYVDYRFFGANCASMLRLLLAPTLGPEAPRAPLVPWESPVQVLEALGDELSSPQLDEASSDRSRRAARERASLVKEAPGAVRSVLGETTWRELEGLEAAPSIERARVYLTLSEAALPQASEAWRAQVLLQSMRVERFALDRANLARLRVERAAVRPEWTGPSTDELLAARQRRYEQGLSPANRAEEELGQLLELDAAVRRAPRRPFTEAELATLAEEDEARGVFEAAAAAVGALPAVQLDAALDREREEAALEQREAATRAVPESGYGFAYAGIGVQSSTRPLVRVRAALLREELGDQRMRGFGARNQLRLLDLRADLSPGRLESGSVVVADVRTLNESRWGWGAALRYDFTSTTHQLAVQLERLCALLADARLTNFVVGWARLRVGAYAADNVASALLQPQLGLSVRAQLPGSFGNAVRVEVAYAPRLLWGRAVHFEQGVEASAELSLRLGAALGVGFSLLVDVEARFSSTAGPTAMGLIGLGFD